MRVAHLVYQYNIGGAGIAVARLHNALLDSGIESRIFCVDSFGEKRNVHVYPKSRLAKFFFLCLTKFSRHIADVFYKRPISWNIIPSGIANAVCDYKPDVIHIHWISAETLSWRELKSLDFPSLITLHDFWFVNGIDPYPKTDTRFILGFTRKNSFFYERFLFRRKLEFFSKGIKHITAPSKWACEESKKSIIGRNISTHCISNIFNDSDFNFDLTLRYNSPKFRLLFGANHGTSNSIKGFSDVCESLKFVPKEIRENLTIRVFGEMRESYVQDGVKIEFLGMLKTVEELVKAYHSADAFLFPSRFETQGQTKIEAMLCGLPVIAFNRSACAEGIEHLYSGYVAKASDCNDYARGIMWAYKTFSSNEKLNEIRQNISQNTRLHFSRGVIVREWIKAYQSLIDEAGSKTIDKM